MNVISRPFHAADGILVDTSAKLALPTATALWHAGVRGVIRYFFFGPAPAAGDLDAAELAMLLDLGMWVGAVVHVPFPGWTADGPTGLAHSTNATAHAAAAGYVTPPGQHPICLGADMEGVRNVGQGPTDYARQCCQVRVARVYQPLIYVGYASGLTGQALDGLGADASCGSPALWCDFAPLALRPSPKAGYDLHQRAQSVLGNVGVDVDVPLRDGTIYGLAKGA